MNLKRLLRYFGLALTILFLFWIIGVVVVYFFVNVNDVKNFAVKTVNENTSGELSLGEIKLKVFPLVHFEISDISFKSSPNFDKQEMFACKNAKLSFNLFTLIIGKPRITLRLYKPSINLVSDGKTNNINDTFKTEKKKSSTDALSYLFISKFIFRIDDAEIKYKTPKDSYGINGLDMVLDIDPVSRNLNLDLSTPIDYKKLDTIIKGDLKLNAKVKVSGKESSSVNINLDASKLLIDTKLIEKKKGDLLKLIVSGESDLKTNFKVKDITLFLVDEFLKINGSISSLSKVDMNVSASNKFDLSILGKIIKPLKEYKISGKLGGTTTIKGDLPKEGTSNKLILSSVLDLTNSEIQGDLFNKAKNLPLTAEFSLLTDMKSVEINKAEITFKNEKQKDVIIVILKGVIKGMDLDKPVYDLDLEKANLDLSYIVKHSNKLSKYPLTGSLSSKAKISGSMTPLPIINLQADYSDEINKNNLSMNISNTQKGRNLVVASFSSAALNLTPYLPKTEEPKKTKLTKKATGTENSDAVKAKNTEEVVVLKKETVESIKKLLDKYSIKLNAKINKLTNKDLVIDNFVLDGLFTKDELSINKMNLGLLKGNVAGNLKIGLNVDNPKYNGKLDLKGVKVKDAAGLFMPGIKGVIDGVVSSGIEFTASGYNMSSIKKTITGKGNFSLNKFIYSAEELNAVVNEKLKDKIGSLAPSSDKKIFGSNLGWETVQGTYNIKDAKINIEQFIAKEGEYEATGKGELTFTEYMDMFFDVSVPYKNIPYEGLRIDNKDKSKLSLHLTGPILKPKFDAEYFVKYIADKALNYEANKVKQQLKSKAEAEAKKALQPVVNDQLKNVGESLKKAFKGLKF
ncbi:MAG: AsmA family protein [bacterium]